MECKESLVSSACGEDTGKLAFHILRLDAVKDMNKKPCIITRKSNYESEYQLHVILVPLYLPYKSVEKNKTSFPRGKIKQKQKQARLTKMVRSSSFANFQNLLFGEIYRVYSNPVLTCRKFRGFAALTFILDNQTN